MYGILLGYQKHEVIEAVVMRATAEAMSVVPRGCSDTVELRRVGEEWIDEGGEPIGLGFVDCYAENLYAVGRGSAQAYGY